MELAGEALRKAQVLDPDYRLAWVAQALMEESSNNFAKSSALIEHSLGMKLNSVWSILFLIASNNNVYRLVPISGMHRKRLLPKTPIMMDLPRHCYPRSSLWVVM